MTAGTPPGGTTCNEVRRLAGAGLIPASVRAEQAVWYTSVSNEFGLPLHVPHSYAKVGLGDVDGGLVVWVPDQPAVHRPGVHLRQHRAKPVPSTDLYDTIKDQQVGFQARPVQGGIFALLTLGSGRA